MSRPDRWWRPATTRRPPLRARRPRMYTGRELDATFDTAYECGEIAERKRHEERERKFREREEQLRRLADASEAASNGDPGPMDELMREQGFRSDDLSGSTQLPDVAEEAGVTPLDEERYERNGRMVLQYYEAKEAGPEAFAALVAEWGVSPEVLGKTPLDGLLDVVEAARMVADLEAWLRDQ